MTSHKKTWIQRKITALKQKRQEFRRRRISAAAQRIRYEATSGKLLTPRILGWLDELEKVDPDTAISIKVLDISNKIKKNIEPTLETIAWLKKFDKSSIVPAGFRDLDVQREWRWVWDEYPLNQFRIALKFAPQQENLQQVVDGLHELVNISNHYGRTMCFSAGLWRRKRHRKRKESTFFKIHWAVSVCL